MKPTFEEEMLACRRWLQRREERLNQHVERISVLEQQMKVQVDRIRSLERTDEEWAGAVDAEIEQLKRRVRCLERIGEGECEMVSFCHPTKRDREKQFWHRTYGTAIEVDTKNMTNDTPAIVAPGTFPWACELMRRGRWLTYGMAAHFQYTMGPTGFMGKNPGGLPFDCPVCVSMLNSTTWKLAK